MNQRCLCIVVAALCLLLAAPLAAETQQAGSVEQVRAMPLRRHNGEGDAENGRGRSRSKLRRWPYMELSQSPTVARKRRRDGGSQGEKRVPRCAGRGLPSGRSRQSSACREI